MATSVSLAGSECGAPEGRGARGFRGRRAAGGEMAVCGAARHPDARPSQESPAPIFKRLAGRRACSMKSTTIKATLSWPSLPETRDRSACEGGRVGPWGRSTQAPVQVTDRGILAEAAAWTGIQRMEKRRLLTREIKRIYMPSSLGGKMLHHRGWLQNYTSPTPGESLLFGQREDNEACRGHGPRPPAAAQTPGRGQAGPEDLPVLPLLPLVSPLATSRAEGRGTKSHSLKPGTHLLGKAPALSRGRMRAAGLWPQEEGPRARSGQILVFLVTMASFPTTHPRGLSKLLGCKAVPSQ